MNISLRKIRPLMTFILEREPLRFCKIIVYEISPFQYLSNAFT